MQTSWRHMHEGWMDGWMHEWLDECIVREPNGWMDRLDCKHITTNAHRDVYFIELLTWAFGSPLCHATHLQLVTQRVAARHVVTCRVVLVYHVTRHDQVQGVGESGPVVQLALPWVQVEVGAVALLVLDALLHAVFSVERLVRCDHVANELAVEKTIGSHTARSRGGGDCPSK